MDNGSIGTDGTNRLERGALVVQVLGTDFVEGSGSGELVDAMVWLAKLFLEVGEVFHDCSCINDIASAHAVHLCLVLGGLSSLDNILGTNDLALAESMHISVARFEMHAHFRSKILATTKD